MHGATDPHGLPVIAMTLQSTKKTNVVLQSAPESCTIIRESLRIGKYFFNSVLRPFQDYFSSYETGQSVGGRKREIPEKKQLAHPQAEVGLSHMLPARDSNPHQTQRTNTDLFYTFIYPRSSFSRTVRIDD